MNIAFIIPNLGEGGAERVISNLSLYLPESIKKYIVLYDDTGILYPYRGTILNLDLPGSPSPVKKLYEFIARTIKLRKLKKEYKITTSISFLENPNLINILARQKDRVIISVRNYRSKEVESGGIWGFYYKILSKMLYNKADLLIAVSHGIRQDLTVNFNVRPEKIKVIYNAYDIPRIQSMAQEEIEKEFRQIYETPVAATIGRLCQQKGQWHLIRAFSIVHKVIPEATLIIFGEGPYEGYLKKLAEELGIEKNVHFLGFRSNPFKYVAKADLFILPSLFEGFPNSLAEAMACGVPVISTDCRTGPREIFYYKSDLDYEKTQDIEFADSGILVPVCDGTLYTGKDPITREESIMAQCIINMLSDNSLKKRYADNALKRVQDFGMEKMIADYRSLLV